MCYNVQGRAKEPTQRPVGQEAKTSPSHGENRGSIPLRVTKKEKSELRSSDFSFYPSRRLGMESPKTYGITRKRVYVFPFGVIRMRKETV